MGLCKKKKSLSDEDFEKEYGRHWIWTSIDPESKLIINFFVGQRTLEDCRIFIGDLIDRICTKPLFTSDELPHYQTVLLEHYSHLKEQPRTGKRGLLERVQPDWLITSSGVRTKGLIVYTVATQAMRLAFFFSPLDRVVYPFYGRALQRLCWRKSRLSIVTPLPSKLITSTDPASAFLPAVP